MLVFLCTCDLANGYERQRFFSKRISCAFDSFSTVICPLPQCVFALNMCLLLFISD